MELKRTVCSKPRKTTSLLILLAFLLLAGHVAAQEQEAPPGPGPLAPQWQTGRPGMRLSTGSTQGADGPVIAIAPDGSKLMAAYNYFVTGPNDRDPYATVLSGQTWSPPSPVLLSQDSDSAQVALTYDANNVAHLIWEEPDIGLGYMRNDGSGWSHLNFIASTTTRVFGTSISATSSQTLDVVWSAKPNLAQNPNIYHSRSTNGGNTWSSPQPIAVTTPTSQAPKIAHDQNGRPHVVWQESTAAPGFEIRYSRGLPWTQPITVSTGDIENARRPALAIAGNTLHLAFTRSVTIDAENFDQWAYYMRCDNNCSAPGSWTTPVNASGQPVRVNESAPFDLIPTIATHQGCHYIFFHGYVPSVSNNEVIWDVNSCDGWSAGGRDQVTGANMRSIYPQVAMFGDTIHLVYEWISGTDHQIYYMKGILPEDVGPGGDGNVYLPIINRP